MRWALQSWAGGDGALKITRRSPGDFFSAAAPARESLAPRPRLEKRDKEQNKTRESRESLPGSRTRENRAPCRSRLEVNWGGWGRGSGGRFGTPRWGFLGAPSRPRALRPQCFGVVWFFLEGGFSYPRGVGKYQGAQGRRTWLLQRLSRILFFRLCFFWFGFGGERRIGGTQGTTQNPRAARRAHDWQQLARNKGRTKTTRRRVNHSRSAAGGGAGLPIRRRNPAGARPPESGGRARRLSLARSARALIRRILPPETRKKNRAGNKSAGRRTGRAHDARAISLSHT